MERHHNALRLSRWAGWWAVLLLLFWGVAGSGIATAQNTPDVSFPITVSTDAGDSRELTLGLDPEATAGIDTSLGEAERPPVPPSDIFDARLIDDDIPASGFGQGLVDDYRQGSTSFRGTKEHEIQIQPGASADSVTIAWTLPSGVTGQLRDVVTGGSLVDASMVGKGTYTLTNLDISKLRVTITYANQNQAPGASGDSYATVEGRVLQRGAANGVLANDTDPNGDDLTASVVEDVSNGTLTLNADGSFSYAPDQGFTGTDRFTYEVDDGRGGTTQATATIDVQATQEPAVAFPFTVTADTSSERLTMGIDPDATAGIDPAFGELEQPPRPPSGLFDARWVDDDVSGTGFGEGLLTDIRKGGSGFTGAKAYEVRVQPGEAEKVTFSWTLPDGVEGRLQDVATGGDLVDAPMEGSGSFTLRNLDVRKLTVTLNFGPPDAADDEFATKEGTTLSVTEPANGVLANDSDPSGDNLAAALTDSTSHGKLVLNGDGTFEYTPDAGFDSTDSFVYRATDGNGGGDRATVTLTVTPEGNDPPTASADSFETAEDTSLTIEAPGVLANDTDPDGDAMSASVVKEKRPSNGTLTLESDGAFTYTPNSDFNGTDRFTYQVVDGNGNADRATVRLTVSPVNDAPTAAADSFGTAEDRSLSVTQASNGVLANDTDPEEGPLAARAVVSQPANGTVTLRDDGTLDYAPAADFNGTDTFRYEVTDGLETDTATAEISVVPVNDPPTAARDTFTVAEAGTLAVEGPGILANDTDPDVDSLTASLVTGTTGGALSLDADGSFTYAPNAGFSGTDEFTYAVADTARRSGPTQDAADLATVTIEVKDANSPPTAAVDSFGTAEDRSLSVTQTSNGVLANDADPDGDALVADTVITGPSNGTVTLRDDGTLDYAPAADFNGTDRFKYEVTDGSETDTATAEVTVVPVNDPPTGNNDTYTTNRTDTLTVGSPGALANDTDPDVDSLTASLVAGVSNGTLTLDADGSFTYDPNAGFSGTDEFTYAVADTARRSGPTQDAADLATVTIEVKDANSPPTAAVDSFGTAEDRSLSVTQTSNGVLANDADPDGDALVADTVITGPSNGTVTLRDDGTLDYAPAADFNGTDTFKYEVTDGAEPDTATAEIRVVPVNDPPTASADSLGTAEGTTLMITDPGTGVRANDTDPDGDTLTVSLVASPSNGTLDTLKGNGTFTYTPDAGFVGTDRFTYRVNDGDQELDLAEVKIGVTSSSSTLTPSPASVTARSETFETPRDSTLSVEAPGVLGNDETDVNGGLTASLVDSTDSGTITLNDDGSLTYSPDSGFVGTDRFKYAAINNDSEKDTVASQIQVIGVNRPPVGTNDTLSTSEDEALTVKAPGVLENDTDPDGDSLTASLVSTPANGTLTLNPDGSFTYTPNANYNGSDEFTYSVADTAQSNAGPTREAADLATVTITINPANDAPVAEADTFETPEGQSLQVAPPGVLASDNDADGDALKASVVRRPQNGTLDTLRQDGGFTYTPSASFTGTAAFKYAAADDSMAEDTTTVAVKVVGVNEPPTAAADTFATPEDTTLSVVQKGNGLLVNDTDPDGDALVADTIITGPSNGTVTLRDDGTFDYDPADDYNGTDSFVYQVGDGQGEAAQATATIQISPTNDAPTVAADSFGVVEDSTLTVPKPGVLKNDSDAEGSSLTASLVDSTSNGRLTFQSDGSLRYTPNPGFGGTDTLVYEATDGKKSSRGTVKISVVGVNSVPVAVADTFATPEDTTLSVVQKGNGLLVNDTDPDGDALVADTIITGPSNGTVTLRDDGTFDYDPADDYNGTDSFVYQVGDGQGEAAQATVTVRVTPVNDAPSITSIPDTTLAPGTTTTGPLAFTIRDVEDPTDSLSVLTSTNAPAIVPRDSIDLAGSGTDRTVTVTPVKDASGTAQITVGVTDGRTSTSTSFSVTVTSINEPPEVATTIPDDTLLTPGPPLRLAGLETTIFNDPNGDDLTFKATSSESNVVQVLGRKRDARVLLKPENTGSAKVVVQAFDDARATAADTFSVTVEQRPEGQQQPSRRAQAVIDTAGASTTVNFGATGASARFNGVRGKGTVEVSFFPDTSGASASSSFDPGEKFQSVSPYRWKIDDQGVAFDSADVAFALSDSLGVDVPTKITIIKDSEGDGTFEKVRTAFSDGGTPSDSTDDLLIAQGLTEFSTFKFASNSSDNPLPVELVQFAVRLDAGTARLQWRTASETNNAGFEVQHRGPDTDGYQKVGYVESKADGGTTTTPKTYQFKVTDLVPGTHRFRLRQVDIDGTAHLSRTTTLTVRMTEALRLTPPAPNPVRVRTRLQFGVRKAGKATIHLYNVLGQRVATLYEGTPPPGEMQTIRIGNAHLVGLPSGVYFVRLRANGEIRTRRMVVVH